MTSAWDISGLSCKRILISGAIMCTWVLASMQSHHARERLAFASPKKCWIYEGAQDSGYYGGYWPILTVTQIPGADLAWLLKISVHLQVINIQNCKNNLEYLWY